MTEPDPEAQVARERALAAVDAATSTSAGASGATGSGGKKKRGRPKKKEPPPSDVIAVCAEVWAVVFGVVARSQGDKWILTAEEKARLGLHTAAVVQKYFPDFLERFGEELALAFVLAGVWYTRRMMSDEKKAEAVVEDRDATPSPRTD